MRGSDARRHDIKVYTYNIRSILEHTEQVWQDIPAYLSDAIESIQRRALTIIFPNSSYQQALEGVMNGPLKFLTARKILPLLDLLAKIKRVLACSCSPNFALLASSQSKFFISARARKKIAVLGMLANARKDHS